MVVVLVLVVECLRGVGCGVVVGGVVCVGWVGVGWGGGWGERGRLIRLRGLQGQAGGCPHSTGCLATGRATAPSPCKHVWR